MRRLGFVTSKQHQAKHANSSSHGNNMKVAECLMLSRKEKGLGSPIPKMTLVMKPRGLVVPIPVCSDPSWMTCSKNTTPSPRASNNIPTGNMVAGLALGPSPVGDAPSTASHSDPPICGEPSAHGLVRFVGDACGDGDANAIAPERTSKGKVLSTPPCSRVGKGS